MNFIIAASTDIGNTKSTNQDSVGARVFSTNLGKIVFVVLCDGMGGLAKGEVASGTVVNDFMEWSVTRLPILCNEEITDNKIISEWTSLVNQENNKIKIYGQKSAINLGTTIVAALFTSDRYYIINVGDSRAYEIYNRVKVITKDQTFVEREVDLGNLTREQANVDSRRSVLLQCVGASDNVYPDFFFGDTICNSVYMFCSDGFRHEITEQEIFDNLQPNAMLSEDGMKQNMGHMQRLLF